MKKVKHRHNKKRNTAFLYETIIREIVKSVIEKDDMKKRHLVSIIREHFSKKTNLYKELEIYKAICETSGIEDSTAEKIISEAKLQHSRDINEKELFNEQTSLINKINKIISPQVFSNFIPNYKTLATISQIFNTHTAIKKRVLLEKSIVNKMSSPLKERVEMKPINNLIYKTFIKKFNSSYDSDLSDDQKELLGRYVMSFADNGADFKAYLSEELGRLKSEVNQSMKTEEINQDHEMFEKTKKVLNLMESFKEEKISNDMLTKMLKIQKFTSEIKKNDSID